MNLYKPKVSTKIFADSFRFRADKVGISRVFPFRGGAGSCPQYGRGNLTYSPCQVSCHEGYSIVGPNKLQCLPTGQYDHPMPQCITKPISSETFCGQRNDTYGRVYGGTETIPGEFPWNVLIEFDGRRFCGGSIIGSDLVLSAGHCLLRNIYSKCSSEDNTCRFLDPER